MMLFRSEESDPQPSPEQMQEMVNEWQDWIGGLAAQVKFVTNNALGHEGRTADTTGVVTDGPFVDTTEM